MNFCFVVILPSESPPLTFVSSLASNIFRFQLPESPPVATSNALDSSLTLETTSASGSAWAFAVLIATLASTALFALFIAVESPTK